MLDFCHNIAEIEKKHQRRLRRGGERVRYSFSSLAAGGATWFAPG